MEKDINVEELIQMLLEEGHKSVEEDEKLRQSLIKSTLNILNHHDDGKYLYMRYDYEEFDKDWIEKFIWANNIEHAEEMFPGYEFYEVINDNGGIDLESAIGF